MNGSAIYDNFKGYNEYPSGVGEEMIRSRLSEQFEKIIKKNEECLVKAKDMRMEKIMSRVLQVKTRTERIKKEMDHKIIGGEYTFDKISASDESELREVDLLLENFIQKAYSIIEPMDCLETDMKISEHFAELTNCFMEIEHLFHKRMEIFKRKRVYA